MDSEPATGCSSCGGGDQLWARLSAVAPGAAHGILRARRGCARQTRGVSVTTPAGEGPSDTRRLLVITYDFGPDGDRKSTGLNSSHTVISYAVFCLKKKKQNVCKTSA